MMFFLKYLDIFHLNITIVNSCDSNVTVKTNSTDLTDRPIFILVGGRHQIVSVSPKNQWIFIKAYNATTNDPLTIDGQDEIVVSYSINKYSYVYYVASGEFSQTFSNSKLIYSLRCTIPCFMWTSDEEVQKAQQFVPILFTF